MGYKKLKEPRLVDFLYFMYRCPLQDTENESPPPYCKSRSKEKQEIGHCGPCDCPLCYPVGWEDFFKMDEDLFWEWVQEIKSFEHLSENEIKKELFENDGVDKYDPPEAYGCSWCVQCREV
jgi:hypothetical protein